MESTKEIKKKEKWSRFIILLGGHGRMLGKLCTQKQEMDNLGSPWTVWTKYLGV